MKLKFFTLTAIFGVAAALSLGVAPVDMANSLKLGYGFITGLSASLTALFFSETAEKVTRSICRNITHRGEFEEAQQMAGYAPLARGGQRAYKQALKEFSPHTELYSKSAYVTALLIAATGAGILTNEFAPKFIDIEPATSANEYETEFPKPEHIFEEPQEEDRPRGVWWSHETHEPAPAPSR